MSSKRYRLEDIEVYRDHKVSGVHLLLANILQRAIRDYFQYKDAIEDRPRFEYALDAWEWFMEDSEEDITDFISICGALSLDAQTVRVSISNLADSKGRNGRNLKNRRLAEEENLKGETSS